MKKNYSFASISLICFFFFLTGCQKENHTEFNGPDDYWIKYTTFELQNIDSVRYWGDSEKIRLKSVVIMLNPDNHTYYKTVTGTSDEALDPAQLKWSKEESGKYSFSIDSMFVFFNNDLHSLVYFPGYRSSGIYHPPRLEQHDSIWYSISLFSMGVSGRFIYSQKQVNP